MALWQALNVSGRKAGEKGEGGKERKEIKKL